MQYYQSFFISKCIFCEEDFFHYSFFVRSACFTKHLKNKHHINDIPSYIVMVYLNGIWPICKCGCGGRVAWMHGDRRSGERIETGFGDFIHGHHIRLNNPNDDNNVLKIKSEKQTRFWQQLRQDPIAYQERCDLQSEAAKNISEEGKANIRASFQDPERNRKLSEANKGKVHDKEWVANSTRSIRKFWDEHPERKEEKSLSQTEKIMTGQIWKEYCKGKIAVEKCSNHDIISYRSSYEKKYIEELESDNNVKDYLFEGIRLPYLYEGRKKHFIVDFIVNYMDEKIVFVEVKNDWLLTQKKTQIKIKTMEEHTAKLGIPCRVLSNQYFNK